ncbi:hypothetical protein [Agrococcus casei]|uniref:hypothetical protein n=1 Tax=Agrococcus casei TaxID=343512 RepID=UPI003F908C93
MTRVTFASGSAAETARVLHVLPASDVLPGAVITDVTPFHPVDHTWPDQPGDTGTLSGSAVHNTVMAARGEEGTWHLGSSIPVKRGTEGWEWAVAHVLDAAPVVTEGDAVQLEVDTERRDALSAGHTACHLASLALDAALAEFWSKETRSDPLGNPDFESAANQTSFIELDGAADEYRMGKSLRKKGVDVAGIVEALPTIADAVNAQLADWVAADAPVRIEAEGDTITDMRRWVCDLPEGSASFPCGGTHVTSTGALGAVTVTLEAPDPQTLVMRTSVSRDR